MRRVRPVSPLPRYFLLVLRFTIPRCRRIRICCGRSMRSQPGSGGAQVLLAEEARRALHELEELLEQKGFETFTQAVGAAHRRQEVYR